MREKRRAKQIARKSAPPASSPRQPAGMTRAEVARRLDRSIATVRRMEGSALPTRIDDQGVHRFEPSDVDRLAAELGAAASSPTSSSSSSSKRLDPGERAARVWERYAKGATLVEVVTEVRIHPDEARSLLEKFDAPSCVVLNPASVGELAALGFGDEQGRVSAASILDAARRMRARLRLYREAQRELERRLEPLDAARAAREVRERFERPAAGAGGGGVGVEGGASPSSSPGGAMNGTPRARK